MECKVEVEILDGLRNFCLELEFTRVFEFWCFRVSDQLESDFDPVLPILIRWFLSRKLERNGEGASLLEAFGVFRGKNRDSAGSGTGRTW